MEKFRTIEKNLSGQLIEKKSKFIANIFHVETVDEAESTIKELKKKYHDARHNCYAYIALDEENNIIEKCSDDGEPSGTAGAPMLAILKGMSLCNVLVVVTRYFGGILLGTGGLVRAYGDVTSNTLKMATFKTMYKGMKIIIVTTYSDTENIKYYCRKNNINIVKEEYSDNVEFFIEISNEKLKDLEQKIDEKLLKVIKFQKMEEKYI